MYFQRYTKPLIINDVYNLIFVIDSQHLEPFL